MKKKDWVIMFVLIGSLMATVWACTSGHYNTKLLKASLMVQPDATWLELHGDSIESYQINATNAIIRALQQPQQPTASKPVPQEAK